jgi:hypothetical protein
MNTLVYPDYTERKEIKNSRQALKLSDNLSLVTKKVFDINCGIMNCDDKTDQVVKSKFSRRKLFLSGHFSEFQIQVLNIHAILL